jgi:hypothetical protein
MRGNLGDVVDGIGGLARLAVTSQPVEAARLFGAADAIRDGLAMPLSPSEQEAIEAITSRLRVALGDDGFAAAWDDGRGLSPDEALAAALSLRVDTAESTTPHAEPRPSLCDLA